MAQLHVSASVDDGLIQVLLDDQPILIGPGDVTLNLDDGQKYVITWFVRGTPGTGYAVTVDSPDSAKAVIVKTLGNGGKDFGGYPFRT